jgi:hypothetical protein
MLIYTGMVLTNYLERSLVGQKDYNDEFLKRVRAVNQLAKEIGAKNALSILRVILSLSSCYYILFFIFSAVYINDFIFTIIAGLLATITVKYNFKILNVRKVEDIKIKFIERVFYFLCYLYVSYFATMNLLSNQIIFFVILVGVYVLGAIIMSRIRLKKKRDDID